MLFLIPNSLKNKKANSFVGYRSQHKHSILFHPLTGFADLEREQKRTEGKTVRTYAEAECLCL